MFCFRCGSELPGTLPLSCAACGQRHWNNPKPGAGALVVDAGRLLLVRRSHQPWLGAWDIPGGFCDAGEHPIATAKRELLEETGLHIEVTGFLGAWLDRYDPDADPHVSETTLSLYYHAVPAGVLAPSPDPAEVAEIGWFAPHELPAAIAFPGHIPAVLAAWQVAMQNGATASPLLDQPH